MNTRMVSTSILLATLAGFGLLPFVSNASETTPAAGAVDPFLACVRILSFDIEFEGLSKKLPLYDMTTITFAMLADSSLPTPKERKDLLAWFDRRDRCWKESEALHQAQWPAEIFQLSQEGNAAIHTIGLELYHRKITFGEANKQIENGGNAVRAKLIPIIKRYQDEIAAQKAAAAQIAAQKQDASDRLAAQRQASYQAQKQVAEAQEQADQMQRRQLFMNYLGAAQQQQLQRPAYVVPAPPVMLQNHSAPNYVCSPGTPNTIYCQAQ